MIWKQHNYVHRAFCVCIDGLNYPDYMLKREQTHALHLNAELSPGRWADTSSTVFQTDSISIATLPILGMHPCMPGNIGNAKISKVVDTVI